MFVRLAVESEIDIVVEMACANAEETRPDIVFDEDRVRSTFYLYLARANPTIYVVDDERDVIGFLMVSIGDFKFADGQYLIQEVMYVRPDRRGTQAAALIMEHLLREAERLEVEEIVGGNDNSFKSERTARFLEHYGFERVGYCMRRSYGRQSKGR